AGRPPSRERADASCFARRVVDAIGPADAPGWGNAGAAIGGRPPAPWARAVRARRSEPVESLELEAVLRQRRGRGDLNALDLRIGAEDAPLNSPPRLVAKHPDEGAELGDEGVQPGV